MPLRVHVSIEPDGDIRAFPKVHCTVMWQCTALPVLHVLIVLSPTLRFLRASKWLCKVLEIYLVSRGLHTASDSLLCVH